MNEFACVTILKSLASSDGFYVGLTDDLAARIAKHNAGGVPHTAKGRPWRIKTAVAFRDRNKSSGIGEMPQIAIGPGIQQETSMKVPLRPVGATARQAKGVNRE